MRLRERDKRTLYIRPKVGSEPNAYQEPIPVYGEPVEIRAACQDAGSQVDIQLYGERVKRMLTIYYDGLEQVCEGDGLCIHVAATAPPDYRVVSVAGWDHQVVQAEKIADFARGVAL